MLVAVPKKAPYASIVQPDPCPLRDNLAALGLCHQGLIH